jgi:hypothetical protein
MATGQASTALPYWLMDLDISTTSESGDFMILYSDYSNRGIVTAASGVVRFLSRFLML